MHRWNVGRECFCQLHQELLEALTESSTLFNDAITMQLFQHDATISTFCILSSKMNMSLFCSQILGSIQMWHHLQTLTACATVHNFSTVKAWIYKNLLHLTPRGPKLSTNKVFREHPMHCRWEVLSISQKKEYFPRSLLLPFMKLLTAAFPLLTALVFHWDSPNSCGNCKRTTL